MVRRGAEDLDTADRFGTNLTQLHVWRLRDHRPPITVLLQIEGRPVLESKPESSPPSCGRWTVGALTYVRSPVAFDGDAPPHGYRRPVGSRRALWDPRGRRHLVDRHCRVL